MSSGSSGKKGLTRRSLLSIAGGAAGLLTAKKIVGRGGPAVATPAAPAAPAPVAEVAAALSSPAPVQTPVDAKSATLAQSSISTAPARVELKPVTLPVDDNNVAYDLPEAGQAVLDLLRPLRPGSRLYGWTVVSIHDVHMGAIPVILQDAFGRKFQVDICRKDELGPRAVADTERFSLFLANSGNGRTPSDESHGLGAIALATVLSRREQRGLPSGVMTLRERSRRFPNGSYAAPV